VRTSGGKDSEVRLEDKEKLTAYSEQLKQNATQKAQKNRDPENPEALSAQEAVRCAL
jgi:hypothetical protein